jgi:hypothetical protein
VEEEIQRGDAPGALLGRDPFGERSAEKRSPWAENPRDVWQGQRL